MLASDETIRSEFESIVGAMKIFSKEILRYAGHEVRGAHQERELIKLRVRLLEHASKILLVCDHNKKVLPVFCREGQSHFFGKKGYSLLGVMAIHQGAHHFYDIIIDGYSDQDALQVHVFIQQTIRQSAEQFSKPTMRLHLPQRNTFELFTSIIWKPVIFQELRGG